MKENEHTRNAHALNTHVLSAHALNEKARELAADYLRTEGQLLLVLMEMRRRRLFAELNYSGIFEYCERALKLSRAQAYYFKTVADKSEQVPEIRLAVVAGELSLSQARRIAPVVTKDNHESWIKKAKTLSQKDLEREVMAINPRAHVSEKIRPVASELSELKVAVDRKTEENLLILKEILSQKLGRAATLGEVIAWAAEITRDKADPLRKAQRSISSKNFKIPELRTQALISLGKPYIPKPTRYPIPALGKPYIPQPARRQIPALVKHQVSLRDNMQCTFISRDGRRCEQKQWLDLHHIAPVVNGGLNTADNLRVLCSSHHNLAHSGRGLTG